MDDTRPVMVSTVLARAAVRETDVSSQSHQHHHLLRFCRGIDSDGMCGGSKYYVIQYVPEKDRHRLAAVNAFGAPQNSKVCVVQGAAHLRVTYFTRSLDLALVCKVRTYSTVYACG